MFRAQICQLVVAGLTMAIVGYPAAAPAQAPDHPVITEILNNPPGDSDAPIGRELSNLHQEFIEIYLPPVADLSPSLNKDALNISVYEVEGDTSSSGYTLVNYRIDLPTFDLDSMNGLTGVPRPDDGIIVIGWVDYVDATPSGLAGTPGTRVALINGGVTGTGTAYTFVPINGRQFEGDAPPGGGGTTNFPTPDSVSLINLPAEASSGIIQNGSAAYLLVNRDDQGYVQLYDDADPAHVPPLSNSDPSLASGTVLQASCLLDGFAANDDSAFIVEDQPYPFGDGVDLDEVLPLGGPFSLLLAQVAEQDDTLLTGSMGGGYARRYVDVAKSTETAAPDDPVADATGAYRLVRNEGPFLPTPGTAAFTTSPPKLEVAAGGPVIDVLALTTGQAPLRAANTGGDFPINIAVSSVESDNPLAIVFGPGEMAADVSGQSFGFPFMAVTPTFGAPDGAVATGTAEVAATNANGGDPPVINSPMGMTVTARVLKPTTGTDAGGQPFEATVFVAVQGIQSTVALNEFLDTDLADFLAMQADIGAVETLGHGSALLNAGTNISDPDIVRPWIEEMPDNGEECVAWLNPPGAGVDLATVVTTSAEVQSGASTYDASIGFCAFPPGPTVIKGVRLNIPDTNVSGGSFSPGELVHFVDASGDVGDLSSTLTNTTTTRTFELALIDTAIRFDGSIETGQTDDFGIVLEVAETSPGSPVVAGQFIALSMTGGFGLADVDSLDVPPGNSVANIVYFDLDNLQSVLGIESIESVFVIDAGESGRVEFVEAFNLNLATSCSIDGDCDDGNICTDDSCNLGSQSCEYVPLTGDFDQDGLFCTGIDRCEAGVFVPGVPETCDDGNVCTDDICDEGNDSCMNNNNVSACDDGDICTENDSCSGGTCSGSQIPGCGFCEFDAQCDDEVACTTDTCNTVDNICVFTPDDGQCSDDGVFCNGPEVCVGSLGDPVTGCASAGPPCEDCSEVDGCLCDTPSVVAHASRYLAITPAAGDIPVALIVTTCDGSNPQYVGALPGETTVVPVDLTNDSVIDGSLAALVDDPAEALYLTPAQWGGKVFVTSLLLVPSSEYSVQADCGSPGDPSLTAAALAATPGSGDVNDDGTANFTDIFAVVQAFQTTFINGNDRLKSDLAECMPNQANNFADIFYAVSAFQQTPFATTCPDSFVCP